MEAIKKVCIGCGQKFFDKSYNGFGKYCSQKCRYKYSTRGKRIQVKCDNCYQLYLRKYSHQRYCSLECSKAKQLESLNKRKHPWYKYRFEVFQRDNFTCKYCGRTVNEDNIKLVIDHVEAKNHGGKDSISNLVTSCFECNAGKSDFCLIQAQKEKFNESVDS